MCFYDQYRYACGDWKWGHFRQHCNREWRIGETCGMKLIMQTVSVAESCRLCEKIDAKQRRYSREMERMARWENEDRATTSSYLRSQEIVQRLESEIAMLAAEGQLRGESFVNVREQALRRRGHLPDAVVESFSAPGEISEDEESLQAVSMERSDNVSTEVRSLNDVYSLHSGADTLDSTSRNIPESDLINLQPVEVVQVMESALGTIRPPLTTLSGPAGSGQSPPTQVIPPHEHVPTTSVFIGGPANQEQLALECDPEHGQGTGQTEAYVPNDPQFQIADNGDGPVSQSVAYPNTNLKQYLTACNVYIVLYFATAALSLIFGLAYALKNPNDLPGAAEVGGYPLAVASMLIYNMQARHTKNCKCDREARECNPISRLEVT